MPSRRLLTPSVARCAALAAGAGIVLAGCGLDGPTPEPAPTPETGLSAPDVYARVAPGVGYIETSLGSGTGVLVAPGRLVTNAHVVWPYGEVRVAFADGTEVDPAPVVAQDLLADLAVVDVSAGGEAVGEAHVLPIRDAADLGVGEDVYLVGYPSEVEVFPQPAITRGVLSRRRVWDAIEMPLLQTDARIAGGQSGGALVASDGSVVGFSTMIFGEGDFGLALAAREAVDRVERILDGEDVDGVDPRPLPLRAGRRTYDLTLDTSWAEAVFVLDEPYGTEVALSVDSPADARLVALSPYGDLDLDLDETDAGQEAGTVTVYEYGPYFVAVDLDRPGEVHLTSTASLVRLDDPDDAVRLAAGDEVTGIMDFPGDYDTYVLDLRRGQTVVVTVDTLNFSPDLTLRRSDAPDDDPPLAEGLSGGPLGMTTAAELTADEAGTYVIVVGDLDGIGTGGYIVTVE